jgi:hypothetical protein
MSPQVLSGVLRVVTHPRVFAEPSELEESLAYCELLLAHPRCVVVRPGTRHWMIFADLCRNAEVRGNLVPDAWFAALAMESGARWITLDRDYARFRGLDRATPDARTPNAERGSDGGGGTEVSAKCSRRRAPQGGVRWSAISPTRGVQGALRVLGSARQRAEFRRCSVVRQGYV